jgi:hypothetical protein
MPEVAPMSVEEMVVETLRHLPPAKQEEVLDFARFLANRSVPKRPLFNPIGMFADLNISISAEDIDEARKEMWGNFPREDLP